MPRRPLPKPKPVSAPTDRMHSLVEHYVAWMGAQNFSADTLSSSRVCIGYFLDWCKERSIEDVTEITRPVLERYQRALYYYRKKDGAPLTFRTQATRLRLLKGWFRWLARQNYLLHNPASELLLPRIEFGLTLNSTARQQIYAVRHDLLDLKTALLDFSREKAWVESVKSQTEQVAAAFYDMSKRGISALSELIDKQTGFKAIGSPAPDGEAEDLGAGERARRRSITAGLTADDLFAQSQGAELRKSQTLDGRRKALADANEQQDDTYTALSMDQQKRKANPNDPTLMTGDQRFQMVTRQQSAQALAAAITVRIKAMEDAAEADKKAKAAAEQLAAFQAGAGERLNALYRSANMQGMKDPVARSMYEGQISIRGDADKTTDSEKSGRAAIATQEFRQALAELQQQLASGVLTDLAKEESYKLKSGGDQLRKKTDAEDESNRKQGRVDEVTARGWSQPDEAANSAAKLAAERAYGMEVTHTFQQQLAYMQQIAQLDNQAAGIKVTQAQDELNIAKAAGDVVRAADAQLKLEKAITDQKDQQYKSQTQILVAEQQQSLGAQIQTKLGGGSILDKSTTATANLIAQSVDGVSNALARAAVQGKGGLGKTLESMGKSLATSALSSALKIGIDAALKSLMGLIPAFASVAAAQTAAAATAKGIASATDVGEAEGNAAVAATGAAASVAWIPIVGPALAVAAAGAMFGSLQGYVGMAAFEKGGPVAHDMVAQVHGGEHVLNRDQVAGRSPLPPDILSRQAGSIIPNHMLKSSRGVGMNATGPTAASRSYGGHTFNNTISIYESADASETGRHITNYMKSMIPSAAAYSS